MAPAPVFSALVFSATVFPAPVFPATVFSVPGAERRQPDSGRREVVSVDRWRRRGRRVEISSPDGDGRRSRQELFVIEQGPVDGPVVALLHGFPTCSFDFHRVIDDLSASFRVVAHDHLGFGLSAKPPRAEYSLVRQADRTVALWRSLGLDRLHLVAHDYGTSVATELLLRPTPRVDSLTLSNGSVLIELARLRLTQKILRLPVAGRILSALAGERFFRRRMAGLWGRGATPDGDDLSVLWRLLIADGGRAVLPAISRYVDERRRLRGRWLEAWRQYHGPAQLLWGTDDPVAVPAIPEALSAVRPAATLSWLDGTGHYPMLEAPEAWARAVADHVDRAEAAREQGS